MPANLAPEVAKVWEEVVPGLISRGVVAAQDAIGLETLCTLIATTRKGPLSARMASELRSWLRGFALTPDAPLRLDPPSPPPRPTKLDRFAGPNHAPR